MNGISRSYQRLRKAIRLAKDAERVFAEEKDPPVLLAALDLLRSRVRYMAMRRAEEAEEVTDQEEDDSTHTS